MSDQKSNAHDSYQYFDSNLNYAYYTGTADSLASPVIPDQNAPVEPAVPSVLSSETLCDQEEPFEPFEQLPATASGDDNGVSFRTIFNFNESLLKIFWRIDVDRNNRVNKAELESAVKQSWFSGDDATLAEVLFVHYHDIAATTLFTDADVDAGLSVNQILNFPPFADLATMESDFYHGNGDHKKRRPASNFLFNYMLSRR